MIRSVCLMMFLLSCGSGKKVIDSPASETMTPRSEQAAPIQQEMVEITFIKGKEKIGSDAKEQMKELYVKFESEGVTDIKAITWGDLEYPSVYNSRDVEEDTTLVVKRNLELGEYLKELTGIKDIELFNMAERSTAIHKIASDENIKKSLETAGIPNTDTAVKVPGKASKSIVIFIREEE